MVDQDPDKPSRAGLLLTVLLIGAAVSNINLSIANTAMSSIAESLNATQSQQNLISDAFSLALAATVLYLGAVGDKHGRRPLLLLGAALSVPASIMAAYAPNVETLFIARIIGGVAAALLFPTTLSIISARWRGRAKGNAISLWSGVGGSSAFLGSVVAGALLLWFWWGSVFLFTAPFALLVLVLGWFVVPDDGELEQHPTDHIGGLLSMIGVAALVLGINELSSGITTQLIVLLAVGFIGLALFFWRQTKAPYPLVELPLAKKPTFWVAAVAGTISFGAMLGAIYVGQQFTENVLRYSAFESALMTIPAAVLFLGFSPVASSVISKRGGRVALAIGIALMGISFVIMAILWQPNTSIWVVILPYSLVGIGVAFAGAAASSALMDSVPTRRAGMGSAFTDLTRDFGGALIQAIMSAILTVAYAGYMTQGFNSLPKDEADKVGTELAQQIASSFQTAEQAASSYPQAQAENLMQDAVNGFTDGKTLAFAVAVVLSIIALVCVIWKYPRKQEEQEIFDAVIAENEADAAKQS